MSPSICHPTPLPMFVAGDVLSSGVRYRVVELPKRSSTKNVLAALFKPDKEAASSALFLVLAIQQLLVWSATLKPLDTRNGINLFMWLAPKTTTFVGGGHGASCEAIDPPVSIALTLVIAELRPADKSLLRLSISTRTISEVALRLAAGTVAGQGREVLNVVFSKCSWPHKDFGYGNV